MTIERTQEHKIERYTKQFAEEIRNELELQHHFEGCMHAINMSQQEINPIQQRLFDIFTAENYRVLFSSRKHSTSFWIQVMPKD